MRLHEELIKQAILHPDKDVRSDAVLHFSRSCTHDESILPLAIQAIEQYGWEEAFSTPYCITGLPLTDETLQWVLAQLQHKDAKKPDSFGWAAGWHTLNSLLSNADAELLARHKEAIFNVDCLEDNVVKIVSERIDLLSKDVDDCWRDLGQFCEESKDAEDISEVDLDHAFALCEAIARQKDRSADKALAILAEKIEDLKSNPKVWMEVFAVRMAGEMRLEPAVPLIIEKLKEGGEEAEWLGEQCEAALMKIGGNVVVQAMADLYRGGEWHLRMAACNVLHFIHNDLAVSMALELITNEDDGTLRAFLAGGLASHLSFEAIEPLRQLVIDGTYDETESHVKNDLVVAATLMGVDFPEREQWKEEVKQYRLEQKLKREAEENERLQREIRRLESEKQELIEKKRRLEEDQYEDDDVPSRHIGRNDPCPCGSGKKFKKCCIRKQQGESDLFE